VEAEEIAYSLADKDYVASLFEVIAEILFFRGGLELAMADPSDLDFLRRNC